MRSLLVLALCLAAANAANMWDLKNVTTLTTENFDEYLDAHPLVLVEFYVPVREHGGGTWGNVGWRRLRALLLAVAVAHSCGQCVVACSQRGGEGRGRR